MSKPSAKSHHHRRKSGGPKALPKSSTSDRAIYLGFIIIGAAIVAFGFLMSPEHWGEIALGYIIALALLINVYAIGAYRGRTLAPWQRALARLPLRCAGFGTRRGKPLEAAHGAPPARSMIFLSIVVSLAIIFGLSFVLIPGLLR